MSCVLNLAFYAVSWLWSMSSEEDAKIPEHADDRPVEEEDEEEEQEAPSRSFGAALGGILADTRTGGPSLPPGTQRKRAAEMTKMKELQEARETRRKLLEKDRVVPEPSAAAYERRLMKVATRGVVRLFNAVAAQRTAHDAEKEDEEDTKPQTKAGALLNREKKNYGYIVHVILVNPSLLSFYLCSPVFVCFMRRSLR